MKNWTPVGDGKSVPSRAYEQILSYIGAEDIVGSKLPPETEFAELLGLAVLPCEKHSALRGRRIYI